LLLVPISLALVQWKFGFDRQGHPTSSTEYLRLASSWP